VNALLVRMKLTHLATLRQVVGSVLRLLSVLARLVVRLPRRIVHLLCAARQVLGLHRWITAYVLTVGAHSSAMPYTAMVEITRRPSGQEITGITNSGASDTDLLAQLLANITGGVGRLLSPLLHGLLGFLRTLVGLRIKPCHQPCGGICANAVLSGLFADMPVISPVTTCCAAGVQEPAPECGS
jgi:hypothetical protein